MIRNLYRIISIGIYPLIVFLLSFYIIKKNFKEELKNNWKAILINLLIFIVVISLGLVYYFNIEDSVYVYDNAGYYVRSLEMLDTFFLYPDTMFSKVFNSINNSDYSYLPSLFNFYGLLINKSYVFYCWINLIIFLVPICFILELLYFKYFSNKYLPCLILLSFYPMWLTIFYGRVDVLGLFPLLIFYIIVLFNKFEDINYKDTLMLNFLCLLLMFERRWYLYALVGIYLVYLIKTIIYMVSNKDYIKPIIKFICSGLLAFIILLVFFSGFIKNVMTVDNAEAYTFYNHSGKLMATLNYYSLIIDLVSLYGLIRLFIKDRFKAIALAIVIIIPSVIFWRTQSFDIHHYLILCLAILILFVYGLMNIPYKKISVYVISLILIAQSIFLFIDVDIPLFTNVKRLPDINPYKEGLKELDEYLMNISSDGSYTFVASGNYLFNNEAIKNSALPRIDFPNIISNVFDIRDGFPKDFEWIKYFVITDPTLYYDEDLQHMYDVIKDAILNNEEISSIFTLINTIEIDDDLTVYVYEQTGEYTQDMKQYFYDKMLEYYPDKADFYSYILD